MTEMGFVGLERGFQFRSICVIIITFTMIAVMIGSRSVQAGSTASVSFSVTPLTVNFGLKNAGESFSATLNVTNTGDVTTDFTIESTAGGSAQSEWLSISPSQFTLNPGSSSPVVLTITLPATVESGGYYYLVTTKPVADEDAGQIGLGSALTTTITFTVSGVRLDGILPDDVPKSQQQAVLLFRNYQNQSVIARADFQVFDGSSVLVDLKGDERTVGAFQSPNQSYQTFWKFNFSTSSLNGTYLGQFTVTYYFTSDSSSNSRNATLRKFFVVGYYDGSVDVNVIESRAAHEPTMVQFVIHNRGTLPFSVNVNARLINLATNNTHGNYRNYEIHAPPRNTTRETLLIVPPELGNYSLDLEYSFLGKTERRNIFLTIYIPPSFPTMTTMVDSGQGFNDNLSMSSNIGIISVLLSALGGMIVGFASSNIVASRKKKSVSRSSKPEELRTSIHSQQQPARLLGFIVQRSDGTDLYARRYALEIDFDTSLMSGLIGSMLAMSEEVFHGSSLKKIDLGQYQIMLSQGRYVNVIFMTTHGNLQQMEEVQANLVELIEREGETTLQQMLVDSQEMDQIWIKCEEIIRSRLLL